MSEDEPGEATEPVVMHELHEITPTARGTRDDVSQEAARARVIPAIPNDELAAIAHDLKNPLSVIMLETLVLDQQLGATMPPVVQRGLERIAHNAAYIDRLVSDLLDLASADAGRLELRLERCDLARLLTDAIERSVSTLERPHLRLEIRQPVTVHADAMRIERVVSNLIANALKHGKAPVTVRLEARGIFACVSVIDTGPGLTGDQARTVFDRFRRGPHAHEGYGLGLYISRKIIEAHRGRIGVQSSPDHGSRFFFELPIYSSRSR